MDGLNSNTLIAALVERVGDSPDASQTALTVEAIWREINASLSPVLGERGVAAIYKRSLYVTTNYPWLMRLHRDVDGVIDVNALSSAFREQPGPDASSAARALLQSFYLLLTTLIGASLTERLFRSVWASTTTQRETRPQDSSS